MADDDFEQFEEISLMERYHDKMIIGKREIERKYFVSGKKGVLVEFDRQLNIIDRIIDKLKKP
jgi:hypothetical protein